MPDKLRNPLLLSIFSIFIAVAAIFIAFWPLAVASKLLLSASLVIFVVGLLSYRWGLFLFLLFRPLIDYSSNTDILTIFGLSLNLPTIVGGLMIIFALTVILSSLPAIKEKKLTAAWLVFLLWAVLTLAFSWDRSATIKDSLKFFSVFLGFLAGYVLIRDNRKLTDLIKVIIFSSLLPAAVALYQFFAGTGLYDAGRNRLLGTLTHPNMLAYYLLLPITLAIFVFLNIKKERVESVGYLGLASILIFILFFTYTRGAYLALLIVFFIVGLLKFRKFLVGAILALLLVYALSAPVQARVNSLFNLGADGSVSWRLGMWSDGLGYFKAKPLTGYGFGVADEIFSQNSPLAVVSTDPHNDYLRVAIDGGAVALALYLILILVLLSRLISEYRKEERPRLKMLNLFILALAIALYTMSFGDNLINDTALQWNLWILIGALLATQWTGRNKTDIAVE